MAIPCDTIGAAVAAYLDAGDLTPASRTTYRRVLEGMARQLGPGRPVAELDAGELAAWFGRTRAAHGPATWNRDRVIVRAFVRHLQAHGAALELPALEHHRVRADTTRALSRADVTRILGGAGTAAGKTLWRLLYESAARVGEVLALDVTDLDLANRRACVVGKGGQVEWITWSTGTATLLPRLLRGRRSGPVFTTRRPPASPRPCSTGHRTAPRGCPTGAPKSCSRPPPAPPSTSCGTPRSPTWPRTAPLPRC
jgi:integrase